MSHRLASRPVWWRCFIAWCFLFSDDSGLCQLGKILINTMGYQYHPLKGLDNTIVGVVENIRAGERDRGLWNAVFCIGGVSCTVDNSSYCYLYKTSTRQDPSSFSCHRGKSVSQCSILWGSINKFLQICFWYQGFM